MWSTGFYLELESIQASWSRREPACQSPPGEQGSHRTGYLMLVSAAGNKLVGPDRAHSEDSTSCTHSSDILSRSHDGTISYLPQTHCTDGSCQHSVHQGSRTGGCVSSICLLSPYLLLWESFEPPNSSCHQLSR